MVSKLLLVIIPVIIAGIFGIATIMIDNNQGGESGDTISVIGSEETIIITGDENQVIINQNMAELQELKQNQLLIFVALGIEPQIDLTQKKEIPQETLQTIREQSIEIDRLSRELVNAGQEQSVDFDLQLRESSAYYYSGDYEIALAIIDYAILTFDPTNIAALNNKGVAFYNQGYYEGAIRFYDKALAIDPNFDVALSNKNLALKKLT